MLGHGCLVNCEPKEEKKGRTLATPTMLMSLIKNCFEEE